MTANNYQLDSQPEDAEEARRQYVDHLAHREVEKHDAKALAKIIIDARTPRTPFDVAYLSEVLARGPLPADRIAGIMTANGNTGVIAPRKVGKTTLEVNMLFSLTTGTDFLGHFPVTACDGAVAVLNFEVPAQRFATWAAARGVPADRLVTVNLRGQRNPFANPDDTAELGDHLRRRRVVAVCVDTHDKSFTGESENDTTATIRHLQMLDRFTRETAGAEDLVVIHHSGVAGGQDRARGNSAFEGWADSLVYLALQDERDLTSARFLRAFGRDVDVPEGRLDFDPATKALSYLDGSGSRRDADRTARDTRKTEELRAAAVTMIGKYPGVGLVALGDLLRQSGVSFRQNDLSPTLNRLVHHGLLTEELGPRNARCFTRVELLESGPAAARAVRRPSGNNPT